MQIVIQRIVHLVKNHEHTLNFRSNCITTILGLDPSSNIIIYISAPLFPLHIILLNQLVDILFNIRHVQGSPILCLFNNLSHKFRMFNLLSRFHDSHNRSLHFELSITYNCVVSFILFLWRFFELNLVYFKTV